jgi:iron complex outermembrane recepter protein
MKTIMVPGMLIIALNAFTQSNGKISGTTADDQQKPLENVNILLLKAKDSSLVKGFVTGANGKFEITAPGGEYLLQYSKVGYQTKFAGPYIVTESQQSINAGIIVLTREFRSMKEIVVSARRPFIEQKLDRMIVNIENSIINAGNNGLEVLEKLPGLSVQPNGDISLKGRGGVKVYIDGRPSNLSGDDLANFLRSLTASQIDRIEIISNPSSMFDAAGTGGIINIRMKKDQKTGFNGTVSFGYAQGAYPKYNGSLALNYRNRKINIYANYTGSLRRSLTDMTGERKFRDGSTVISNFIQEGRTIERTRSYNFRTGIDIFLNSRSTLGLLVSALDTRFTQQNNNQTRMTGRSGMVDSMLFSFSDHLSKWNVFTSNINYRVRFDSTNRELTADFEISRYNRNNNQFFRNLPADAEGNFTRPADTLTGLLPALLNLASIKVDYLHPLPGNSKLEAGLKSSWVSNDNDLAFFVHKGSGAQPDRNLSNHFIYEEYINAIYVNYAREHKRWSYQVGLRAEQNRASGNQLTTGDKFTRNFFQLFPTAFLNFSASDDHQLGISYARRVGRPAYNIVNPFRIFRDPYTYSEGNPFIRPQTSNNFEFNYIFKNIIIVSLSYGNTNNSMTFVVRQNDVTKTTVETYDNLSKLQDAGLSVSANFKIARWWSCNNFVGAFYNHFEGVFSNTMVNNSGLIFNASINHSITMPRNYTLEFGGFYLSDQPQGIITIAPQANFNIGLQKQVFQKRGTIRLSFSDVFHTQQWNRITRFANIDASFNTTWDSRQVRLNLSWKFGKQTVPAERRRRSSSEEEKNRIQMDQGR